MESFFTRFKNPLVLIAIVLAQVIALAMQVQQPMRNPAQYAFLGSAPDFRGVALMRRWMVAVVTPLERVAEEGSVRVKAAWWDYIDLRRAREQAQQLQMTVARLREEQAAFAEDAAQGRRLQKLLAFKEQYIDAMVAAQVIGTSGSDRSRVLYLDKGWADGLRPDQAVITPEGVVGKLRDVFPHTAQVLLIDDASSGAGVVLVSSRIRAILRGTANGQVQIDNLTSDSRIKPGERVVTSGGDMVYPRGLPVGVIQSIAPDPSHQPYMAITIKPAANLDQLSEVLVITGTQSTLTPAAEADAAQAVAAAEANRRAADIAAEALPSLHQATDQDAVQDPAQGAAAAAGGSPQPAGAGSGDQAGSAVSAADSGVPHPQPVVHPDRFSPGTTPPAADLTPGGAAQPATPQEPDTPGAARSTSTEAEPRSPPQAL